MAKKILCFVVLMLALVCVFTSCDDNDNKCEHAYVESVEHEPTCGPYTAKQGDKRFTCSICNDSYIEYNSIPALEHEWSEATCTEPKTCKVCGEKEGYDGLGHEYSEIDGTCTRCGYGVKFIIPNTPITIKHYTYFIGKECIIESIKVKRDRYYYRLDFIIQSTYNEDGNNYSASVHYGWKLYDEDGLVVDSGTAKADGEIAVGEKTKDVLSFEIGTTVENGKTYRLELLDIG